MDPPGAVRRAGVVWLAGVVVVLGRLDGRGLDCAWTCLAWVGVISTALWELRVTADLATISVVFEEDLITLPAPPLDSVPLAALETEPAAEPLLDEPAARPLPAPIPAPELETTGVGLGGAGLVAAVPLPPPPQPAISVAAATAADIPALRAPGLRARPVTYAL